MVLQAKIYRIICGVGLLLLTACDAEPQAPESENRPETSQSVTCIASASVKNTYSAVEITLAAKQCAEDRRYSQAAELLVIASAYRFYDMQRVADKPAHNPLDTLFSTELGSLEKYKQTNLILAINALDNDGHRMQQLCHFLATSPPPIYIPRYLINQGRKSSPEGIKMRLANDFNSADSWAQAIDSVYCNPEPSSYSQ